MLEALEEFRKAHHLPPLLWLERATGAALDLEGFGHDSSCRQWAAALDLAASARREQATWAGTLGDVQVSIRSS